MTSPRDQDTGASRTLTAYAFLAQSTHGEADLLRGLAPLFRPIAKANAGKRFEPHTFAIAAAELYGFKMHPWALEDFAPRLAEAGILKKIVTSSGTHDYLYADVADEFVQLSEDDVSRVIQEFIAYAKPLLAESQVETTDDELEAALLAALTNLEFIDVLLKPDKPITSSGRSLLSVARSTPTPVDPTSANRARLDVLCAGFILHAYRTNRNTYDLLNHIVSGALITEVVLEFQSPSLPGALDQLTVVLDSPFLMSFLDLGTPESHTFARDLIEQLREHGARIGTFRHCVEEIRDNLTAVMSATQGGIGHGATARRLHAPAFSTYAGSIKSDPATRLAAAGIAVIDLLATERWFRNFTNQDEQELAEALGHYENPVARDRDAASVAAVIRFRGGVRVRMGRFDTAKFLFVTENPRLVRTATRLLERKQMYREGEAPPAITDRYLAGLLWALYGGKAKELAPKLLLANCAAALEPRSDLLTKMHRFIKDLNPDQVDYFTALMTTERASQHLMEITLGDSDFLTRENAAGVLERLTNTLTEQERALFAQEKRGIEESHAAEIGRLEESRRRTEDQLRDAETRRMSIEAERNELAEKTRALEYQTEGAVKEAEEQIRLRMARIAAEAHHRERRFYYLIAIVATALIVGAGYLTSTTIDARWTLIGWIITAICAFLGFWKIPDLLIGDRLIQMRRDYFDECCIREALDPNDLRYSVDLSTGTVERNPI